MVILSSTMDVSLGARPIHEQKLEKAFKLGPLLDQVEHVINENTDSDSSDESGEEDFAELMANGIQRTKEEKEKYASKFYNFSALRKKRLWLKDVLLSSSESDDEPLTQEDLDYMIKEHKLKKKYQASFRQKGKPQNFLYYSVGTLSRVDPYPDQQKQLAGNKRKRNRERKDKEKVIKLTHEESVENGFDHNHTNLAPEEDLNQVGLTEDSVSDSLSNSKRKGRVVRRDKKTKKLDAETLAVRRYKLWVQMSKKEIGKCHKNKVNARKDAVQNAKKLASACCKIAKQKALQSQKVAKEKVWLLKRLTRTMQTEWKKYERIVKEHNKRAEKEAEEQRKMDKEILEAKRQQRKLNFLITLPELYAHFMKNKDESDPSEGTSGILKQLDDETPVPSTVVDDYDSEAMKAQALKTAEDAFKNQQSRLMAFPQQGDDVTKPVQKEHPQPSIFVGQLKSYQLKGMNWLANLYYFGINGILADEMGLGKTIQSIAFLAHICEEYDTWGPFLIVTPASTLHNWTQEISKFLPAFKVVPYWGGPDERKNLRKFFDVKSMGTRDSSFHVVVTSYQIVVQDYKFLNRIKWNYMVLDEAQAIKSINSQRWKQLLGFSCRNRLLLSGTPIQNSMAELWALLHFIMPTLFDSHSWFNEWFSKDIESNVENRTAVDELHLNRLHLILKPFMLRRVKTEVENELSDKIEIMIYCPLTLRQKFLYDGLKNKISIDELLRSSVTSQSQQTLMNLVMQFRKVCNHPELLERREVKSPFLLRPEPYVMPKMVYREGMVTSYPFGRNHLIKNVFSIFHPHHIHSSLFESTQQAPSCFSFIRLCSFDASDLSSVVFLGLTARLILLLRQNRERDSKSPLQSGFSLNTVSKRLRGHKDLLFTNPPSSIYGFSTHTFYSIPETPGHLLMRSRKEKLIKKESDESSISTRVSRSSSKSPQKSPRKPLKSPSDVTVKKEENCDENISISIEHTEKAPISRFLQATFMPKFLLQICPKTHSLPREFYSCDRSAVYQRENASQMSPLTRSCLLFGSEIQTSWWTDSGITPATLGGVSALRPKLGWSRIMVPDKNTMIMDAGKLYVLDSLLSRLKKDNHRVLIYSQMTKMIDLLEEYMWHRQHKYMRLDGSSKISDRRDMVEDFQNKTDIFVFLLSTRAGGVGINLTAADTVIFYDSDWNPTVDQQAMDRAHRLGQTKQVTVYRLICKSTIEDRIMQRARDKSEIQRMVISGGHFKPDSLKPKEVVSLLLDDDIEKQYKAKQVERKALENQKQEQNREKMRERMRKRYAEKKHENQAKRKKLNEDVTSDFAAENSPNLSLESSPMPSESSHSEDVMPLDEASSEGLVIVEGEATTPNGGGRRSPRGQKKRGRPRGSSSRGSRTFKIGEDTTQAPSRREPGSRRGRGRPRLLSSGPSHMGTRQSTSLPMALQLALQYSTQEASHKKTT